MRVEGWGLRSEGPGFRVQGSGFRFEGAGFRVQGAECMVCGSGYKENAPQAEASSTPGASAPVFSRKPANQGAALANAGSTRGIDFKKSVDKTRFRLSENTLKTVPVETARDGFVFSE